jgi:DNA-binding LacI/PurR family transcriptional regulator
MRDRELEVVAALHQRRVDGIIIPPSCGPHNTALNYMREQHIPIVMVAISTQRPLRRSGYPRPSRSEILAVANSAFAKQNV